MAQFNNVPAGVVIYVGITGLVNGTTGTSSTLTAVLTSTASDGSGARSAIAATNTASTCLALSAKQSIAPVTLSGGAGTAVWEITAANPFSSEQLVVPVFVSYTANTAQNLPGVGSSSVTGNYAPISTVTVASSSAPIPRFASNPKNASAFSVNSCVTDILFPFVTNQSGFDTGIAIANTSLDPFGTPAQAGACTINYYGATTGGGAAPAAQTSSVVPAGTELVFSLSSGGNLGIAATPGFQGYIIAVCKFQYAHGFAFISDLGAQKLAEGYLGIILDGQYAGFPRTGSTTELGAP
jgi:hypothetical protein